MRAGLESLLLEWGVPHPCRPWSLIAPVPMQQQKPPRGQEHPMGLARAEPSPVDRDRGRGCTPSLQIRTPQLGGGWASSPRAVGKLRLGPGALGGELRTVCGSRGVSGQADVSVRVCSPDPSLPSLLSPAWTQTHGHAGGACHCPPPFLGPSTSDPSPCSSSVCKFVTTSAWYCPPGVSPESGVLS